MEETIEYIKEVYGDRLLAIYKRGSSLYNLTLNSSDIDLFVIVRTHKFDLLQNTFHSESIKFEELDIDAIVVDEYKLAKMIEKGTVNSVEVFFEDPVYLSEDYRLMAEFLKENVINLLLSHPQELFGGLYGYFRSYYIDGLHVNVGDSFNGKRFAMMLKSKNLVVSIIHSGHDRSSIREAIIPEEEFREYLLSIKKLFIIETQEQADQINELQTKTIVPFYAFLDKLKNSHSEYVNLERTEEYIRQYIDLMLAPI